VLVVEDNPEVRSYIRRHLEHRSYLLRKLRALTGETPSGLIRSLRLQRAEQLLRANAGTVSEVAYGVGFKSVAHFSNAFQEKYGERPSAFAARWRPSPPRPLT
jgi:AraC-like DNA-binding protein